MREPTDKQKTVNMFFNLMSSRTNPDDFSELFDLTAKYLPVETENWS
mgnify:CR=1 FL=1